MPIVHERNRDRIKSVLGVAIFHALLAYALIVGLRLEIGGPASDALKVFDVAVELPPPLPDTAADAARTREPEGAASPPNLKATASPVIAPRPRVRLEVPPPVIAAPAPGRGSSPSAGASDRVGPGSGAGGAGTGTGSGRAGSGTGGGGAAVRARLVSGRIANADYPRGAGDAGAEGTVVARVSIGADGRVSGCAVARSSGNAELDATTCRLIERRFRYAPARDAQGRPVADVTGWSQTWWIGDRRR